MKMKIHVVWLLFVLCFCFGCGDEGVELDVLGVPAAPAATEIVTDVPPEIASFLWDEFGTREELIARLADVKIGEDNWEFRVNWLLSVICEMDQKRAYYDRYINAGGIAIVGNVSVKDKFFIAGKNIVLKMTSKHPEIRGRMLPRNSRFYMALTRHETQGNLMLPEALFRSTAGRAGYCSASGFCYSTVGFSQTPNSVNMVTFVHEFAHAIHFAIMGEYNHADPADPPFPLDPTFDDRLKHAYETAMALGKWKGEHAASNFREYWAEGLSIGSMRATTSIETYNFRRVRRLLRMIRYWQSCWQNGLMSICLQGVMNKEESQ